MLTEGTKLGRYEIRSLLGAGGMGEVYLATDTELDRSVAIKILPEEMAADQERLQRFVQEAKSASALNHPNILTIYEIGSTPDSRFIAMEFIDGETLRNRNKTGVKLSDTLEIATQIASALSAAHAAGIIHRDIKPENVMVRRDGYAKVLDFGLAKLTEPKDGLMDTEAPTRAMVNTGAGTVLGTASYMSPEQAKGVKTDERTDLWSLGVLIYEMATGHLPFSGETPTETISLILQREPAPLTRYTDEVPEELERIVEKALTKDVEERYQSAKDMLIDLRHLKRKLEVNAEIDRTVPPELRAAVATHSHPGAQTISGRSVPDAATAQQSVSSAQYVVDGIKSHRKTAVAAVVGIAAIVTLAFLYFPSRTPALTEKDSILLADFTNTTGDAVFDGTLKQALAVQLGQSPYLNIFPEDRVNEALRFMGRQPNERITRDIAREICQRQGLKAMILGSIANLGSNYVLTLEAVNAAGGDSLAREQIEADSKEKVLSALGKAASNLREKVGESIASIKKFDAPVEQATTSSLDALKAYTQANELRTNDKAMESIPLFKKAVEIDPNFAMAYARLGVIYSNNGQTDLAAEYSQKAYDLRARVSERERFYIEEKYTSYVTGDRDEAVRILRAWVQSYPNDFIPHSNLAVNLSMAGKYEEALNFAREALRISPNNSLSQGNYVEAFIRLNRLDEAQQELDRVLGVNPERGVYRYYASMLAFIKGDENTARQHAEWFAKNSELDYTESLAGFSAFNGEWQKSLGFTRRSVEQYVKDDRKENGAQTEGLAALYEAHFGRCSQAKEIANRSLALYQAKYSLGQVALTFALCNDSRAQSLVDDLQKRFSKDTIVVLFFVPMTRAAIEMNRGNNAGAIEAIQPAMRFELGTIPGFWLNYMRGQIFLKGKMGNEATAEFQKILDHRTVEAYSPLYPMAHVCLARAYTLTGKVDQARKEYQDFLAMWKNADADLPVLVEAKREYEQIK